MITFHIRFSNFNKRKIIQTTKWLHFQTLDFYKEIYLPKILFDVLLERFRGAVGVPSSMGEVMVLKKRTFLFSQPSEIHSYK